MIIKKFKTLLLISLLTHNFYASDLGPFQPAPQEIIKKISNFPGASGLAETNKFFSELIYQSKINSYVDYVARTNLFNHKFELDEFLKDQYKDMPESLRKQCNQSYNDLMNEPIFFLKFCHPDEENFENTQIPSFIYDQLEVKSEILIIDNIKIELKIINPNKEKEKRLIFVKTDISGQTYSLGQDKNLFNKLAEKLTEPSLSFIRLCFKDLILFNYYFYVNKNEDYRDWFKKRIIENKNFNSILHLDSLSLPYEDEYQHFSNINEINDYILKTKNKDGQTLLFFLSEKMP